jgi:hypothetical protein
MAAADRMESDVPKNMRKRKDVNQTTDRRDDEHALEVQRLDQELDRQLEATFPASDALKITLRHSNSAKKATRTTR